MPEANPDIDVPDIDVPAIDVEGLTKRFAGIVAVNDITFQVGPGEIVGFLGPNGAGKSTTMRILTGFLSATAGRVEVAGFCVHRHPEEVKRRIGYMPESNPLPEDMRIREYLKFRGRLKGLSGRGLRDRLGEVLEICDLHRVDRRLIGKLSKGYRQRVGIADAILSNPEVIIMDEPTIGLDPHQIIMIRDLLASFRGRLTLLISSHILPEIEATCDRVLIINQGRIVASGRPDELRREFFGETAYEIDAAVDQEKLKRIVADVDANLTVSPDGEPNTDGFRRFRIVSNAHEDRGEALMRELPARGVRLRSLARSDPSLEDVFLAATRRSWDVLLPAPGDENGDPGSPAESIESSQP